MKSRISYEAACGDLSIMDPRSRKNFKKNQKKLVNDILKELGKELGKESEASCVKTSEIQGRLK